MKIIAFMALMLGTAVGLQLLRVSLPTIIALVVLVCAVGLDFITTWKCLKHGGKEGNPLVAGLFKKIGVKSTFAITATIWILIIIFRWLPSTQIGQTSMALVYWLVPLNNLMVIRRMTIAKRRTAV
jgi:hypothetical protein